MREHALDGEVGLAGIGRPEHRGDTMAPVAQAAVRRRTEGDGHTGLRPRTDRPARRARRYLYHNATEAKGVGVAILTAANESRTKHARIADSCAIEIRSRPYLVLALAAGHQILIKTRDCRFEICRKPFTAGVATRWSRIGFVKR